MRTYGSAIEELRHMVGNFGDCNESFNMRWTIPELVQIHRMMMASGWDIYPDEWTPAQLLGALRGIPPAWRDDESPVAYDAERIDWYDDDLSAEVA